MMTWFNDLTGIEESSPEFVRSLLSIEGDCLVFPNGKRAAFGDLETPTLGDLRSRVPNRDSGTGRLRVSEVVADIRELHADPANANALFQVASQFNLLEMTDPSVTPEAGVGIYERDHTQGPACAISCGAGTIYRNYFATVGDSIGQTTDRQIDCAADLGTMLGNQTGKLWAMENGYLLPTRSGLNHVTAKLQLADDAELDGYRTSLRIGMQWNTSVTIASATHSVSQAYCSALPVAYGRQSSEQWADFARLVLEAAYESTICAGIINSKRTGSNKLFLTLLGGGAFGNSYEWITDAICRAAKLYRHHDLDVAIVSYGSSKPAVASLVAHLR